MPIDVYFELARTKVIAVTCEWPGWCRIRKTEDAALEALADYAGRYAEAIKGAGINLPAGLDSSGFEIVERVKGNATTEFGAPAMPIDRDLDPLREAEGARLAAILAACWKTFDEVVAGAPAELAKGPRGGGRDRDKIVDHVAGNENAYARKIGVRLPGRTPWPELRDAVTAALVEAAAPISDDPRTWPYRYAARRIAWHVLDHAWEIEDKS